jgi:putative endonuclease
MFIFLTSRKKGALYIGITNSLLRRIWEHKNHLIEGFTKKYSVDKLVWFDYTNDICKAIKKEKQLKKWKRNWKIRLIEENNPCWKDLSKTLY